MIAHFEVGNSQRSRVQARVDADTQPSEPAHTRANQVWVTAAGAKAIRLQKWLGHAG